MNEHDAAVWGGLIRWGFLFLISIVIGATAVNIASYCTQKAVLEQQYTMPKNP